MTSHGAFAAEEFGSGSRPTPLIEAPAWLKAQAGGQSGEGDRATLTPTDRAFLESIPAYEEPGALIPSLPPPTIAAPSTARRVLSLLLFVVIAGGASAVLVLAGLRYLGHPVLP
jgi:hypothetical protein